MDNYEIQNFIGSGAYSKVYKCYNKKDKKYFAIKRIKYKTISELDDIHNEIYILKKVNSHPNVVSLVSFIENPPSEVCIIFSLYPCTLHDLIIEEKLSSDSIKSFISQLLLGLSFIHSQSIIHGDIKPNNIMVDYEKNIKIGDFGISFSYENEYYDPFYLEENETHKIQTMYYKSPEILLGIKEFSFPIDVWSLGCIIGEIILKDVLFRGDSEICQLYEIFQLLGTPTEKVWNGVEEFPFFSENFPKWRKNIDKKFPEKTKEVELIKKLLKYDPKKRISARDAFLFYQE